MSHLDCFQSKIRNSILHTEYQVTALINVRQLLFNVSAEDLDCYFLLGLNTLRQNKANYVTVAVS